MERPQITTLALPRSPTWPSEILVPHQAPFHFMPDVFEFSKFMLATSDYMVAELSRELDELATERRTLERLGDTLSLSFVEAAEDKIRRQLQKAVALDTPTLHEAELRHRKESEELIARAQRRAEYEAQRTANAASTPTAAPMAPEEVPEALLYANGRNSRHRKNVNPPPPSNQTYYFYQAASGAPVFLHPLDIRTLVARFGSYAAFPDRIVVRVEAAQEGSVDDALRKRCKYLGHVAESADVVFVETDLRSVVGDEALVPFEGALKMRRARRKDKDRRDDKARAKSEANERTKMGIKPAQIAADHPVVVPLEVWEELPAELASIVRVAPAPVEDDNQSPQPSAPSVVPGVWGSRSFAGVIHSPPSATPPRHTMPEEEEDLDDAWADLEVRAGNSNKRGGKKSKLVLLGGGPGSARRRR